MQNDARSVLCVACERPRGCKTPWNSSMEEVGSLGLARGRWNCQSCTLENDAATVLCVACDRPRLAGKPGTGDAKPLVAWGEETILHLEDVSICAGAGKVGGPYLSHITVGSRKAGKEMLKA